MCARHGYTLRRTIPSLPGPFDVSPFAQSPTPICLGRLGLLATLILCAGLTGCVHRRMTIRTTPPGAMVYIDDYPIGTTPISHDFTYYGTRKIRLVKDGYETKTILQPVPPPWYEYVPLDFISENLVPGQIRDHHTFDYQLEPQLIVPPQQLTERAELLRAKRSPSARIGCIRQCLAAPRR